MIPTRANVCDMVRFQLGDTQIAAGQIYTNDFQVRPLNLSYQEMFSRLSVAGADRVQRDSYYVLPAFTAIFVPAVAGITNFGLPELIWERGSATSFGISAVTVSSPGPGQVSITLTSPLPASVITGNQVEVFGPVGGISDDINDSWAITVTDPTHIILNGCMATGTFTSGGTVVFSTEQWTGPLDPQEDLERFPVNSPQSALDMFSWHGGFIRFPVCSTAREIKLIYQLSSSLPLTTPSVAGDSMGVDDSLAFLQARTGQLCAKAKGNPKAQALQQEADYHLGVMLSGAARQMQAGEIIVPPQFRPKRNSRLLAW